MLHFTETTFSHPGELEAALKAAAAAHHVHEAETGLHDEDWAGWFADYIFAVNEAASHQIGAFSPWPRNAADALADVKEETHTQKEEK
jgi:hypothetical protein